MQTSLIMCLVIFIMLLILLERLQSIKLIIKLSLSLVAIYGYIEAIAGGKSIVLSSIILTFVLAVINIFIQNGIRRRSFTELIAVLVISGITGVAVFGIFQKFNPRIYKDEIMTFNGLKNQANTILGISLVVTLGVYMDMISKIIFHLDAQKDKTVDTPWLEQFKQGIELGKVYIGEKTNMITLVLLGVLLFPICTNINKGTKLAEVFNQPEVFTYSLIAIFTSIGLLLSVPITACLYACINRKKTIYKKVSENKIDGKRSLKL